MKEIIEKEIKWCEEHRGMKSEVYEEAFIAGLKQCLFFLAEAEKLSEKSLESEKTNKILSLVGELLDRWDELPNDVTSEPELEKVERVMLMLGNLVDDDSVAG